MIAPVGRAGRSLVSNDRRSLAANERVGRSRRSFASRLRRTIIRATEPSQLLLENHGGFAPLLCEVRKILG